MSDEPTDLTLLFLRRLDTKMDALRDDVRDTRQRLTTIEQQVGGLAATEASHGANLAIRLDRMESRMERIERRLDLTEAAR